jgi:CRP-like cAMP-binding protein
MPYQAFEEEVIACPEAARRLLSAHREWLRELGGLASDQMHRPATRIQHALWRDTHDLPGHAISYTHEALADRAGADRPSTSRVIDELRKRGVIETEPQDHRIIVLKPDGLLDD